MESREELAEIGDGRIAKDLRLAVILPVEPLGQVRDEFRQFLNKCLLGHADCLVEPGGYLPALLLVDLGCKLPKVWRRFNAGKVPRHIEQPFQRRWIITRIVETAKPLAGRCLERLVLSFQFADRLVEFCLEGG